MKLSLKSVLLLSLSLFFMVSLTFIVSADYIDDMNDMVVVYYEMEDAASPMVDSLVNVNHTCVNCPDFQVDGIIGFGMNYTSGNSDMMTADANTIFNTDDRNFGTCVWFQVHSLIVGTWIWGQSNDGTNGYRLNDAMRPITWVAWDAAAHRILVYGVNGDISDYGWHQYCYTRDGAASGKAWIDGAEFSDTTLFDGNPTNGEDVFYFGSTTGGAPYYSIATDEFIFFNDSINQTHVTYLYNGGAPGANQQYPFGVGAAVPKRNWTEIIWNVTNNTVYNISNFTGHTMVYFNSTNETAETLNLFENSTQIYSIAATNISYITINLTNLTWNTTSWYHWQSENNITANYSLTYINDSDFSPDPFHRIITNVSNNSVVNFSELDEYIACKYQSWTNLGLIDISIVFNGSLHETRVNVMNDTFRHFHSAGLVPGYYYYTCNTSVNTSARYYINITNISTDTGVYYQIPYSNVSNGTEINLSAGASAYGFGYRSWNSSTNTTKVYLNGTEQCSVVANNDTTYPCDISNLTAVNATYLVTINNTLNASYYSFILRNTSGFIGSGTGEKLDYYMAIALLCSLLVAFLLILSFKIDAKPINKLLFNVPMLNYLFFVITGWVLWAVFDIVIGIVATENITRLSGVTTALYRGFGYIIWLITALWIIIFLYLLFLHFNEWMGAK